MARAFDGASSQYLTVATAIVNTPPFTFAAWMNMDNTNNHVLICVGDTDTDNESYQLTAQGFYSGDPILVRSRDGGVNSDAHTTAGYSADTWHHACGVFTADDDRAVFLDGGNKGTSAVSSAPSGLDTSCIGGNLRSSGVTWAAFGSIADAAIWNVALTDAEVAILAAGYSPLFVRPQSLVAYWPLIRDTDDDIVGGYSMTPVNSPTVAAHPRVFYPGMPHVGYAAAAIAALRIPRHPAAYYGGPTVF